MSKTEKNSKWDFSDYAFTITGILVGVLLVVPEILYSQLGISILGGSLSDMADDVWSVSRLRALSPLLFLLTTTIVFFQEAFVARKDGGYAGSMFTHTFESLLEDAIYMAITTIMVYGAVFVGAMYASWLAGPITWILFMVIFPLIKKKRSGEENTDTPWFLLALFAVGIIAEVITGVWIAFPLTWLAICAIKCVCIVREGNHTIDTIFDVLYYTFSVILLAVGIGFDFWITSWAAFPIALVICWVLSKFKRFKK